MQNSNAVGPAILSPSIRDIPRLPPRRVRRLGCYVGLIQLSRTEKGIVCQSMNIHFHHNRYCAVAVCPMDVKLVWRVSFSDLFVIIINTPLRHGPISGSLD